MAIEATTFVLVALVLGVATLMGIAGLLGVIGALRLERCGICRHLVDAASPCPYCRHMRALHVLHLDHAARHPRAGHGVRA